MAFATAGLALTLVVLTPEEAAQVEQLPPLRGARELQCRVARELPADLRAGRHNDIDAEIMPRYGHKPRTEHPPAVRPLLRTIG